MTRNRRGDSPTTASITPADSGPCTASNTVSSLTGATATSEGATSVKRATMSSKLAPLGSTQKSSSANHHTIRSSSTPPRSLSAMVYWARPGSIVATSLHSWWRRTSTHPGPSTVNRPRWETSNTPTWRRTAMCSASTPSNWSGMCHPAKSVNFAPSAWCAAVSGDSGTSGQETALSGDAESTPSSTTCGGPGMRDGAAGSSWSAMSSSSYFTTRLR